MNPERRVVLAANSAWNILNFRMNLVRTLTAHGMTPVALVPPGEGEDELGRAGVRVETIPMKADAISPVSGLDLTARYVKALRRLRPGAFLGFTPKPNIFGSMAASALRIPVINNVTGLGTAFIHGGLLAALVPNLYRLALRRSHRIFFHNEDDRELFVGRGLASADRSEVIPGSGVDLEKFSPTPLPGGDQDPTFLFIGRLLKEKGVTEFVEAAGIARRSFPEARFRILGGLDAGKRGVTRDEVDSWVKGGIVRYLGTSADVRPAIESADCVVLPSYREGMPRVLLEAAAMGRPLIGTDVPGCRQIVEEGVTGYQCAPRSAESLAGAITKMIELGAERRQQIGQSARRTAERSFSEERVNQAYLDALTQCGCVSPR